MSQQETSFDKNRLWAVLIAAFLSIVSLIYYSVNTYYIYLVVYIWFGVAYGALLQYGRFCLASAFRDLFGLGVTRMFAGIMIAAVIFSFIMAGLESINMSTFHSGPFGGFRIAGGFIFGLGMVMAGGCASGTLYKCGEGNGTSLLAFIAICISQALFVDIAGIFDSYMTGYIYDLPEFILSDFFEFLPPPFNYFLGNAVVNTLLPALLLLIIVYVFRGRKSSIKKIKESKTAGSPGGAEETGFTDELYGFWLMLSASKRTVIAGFLIGITAGAHVFAIEALREFFNIDNFGELLTIMNHDSDVTRGGMIFDPGYWYITTQEAQLGAWFFNIIGLNASDNLFFKSVGVPSPLRNPALWMSFGIVFGATIMALFKDEFKFKIPKGEFIVWGLLGGTLMGLGARLGLGCNIGAFFIKVAGGDPAGWLFGAGLALGSFVCVKFFDWWTTRKLADLDFDDF